MSPTVCALGPVALLTRASPASAPFAAPAWAFAISSPAPGRLPKTMLLKVFFNVLLSKSCMTIAFSMVTSAPGFRFALPMAAQVSPSLVFRRR